MGKKKSMFHMTEYDCLLVKLQIKQKKGNTPRPGWLKAPVNTRRP